MGFDSKLSSGLITLVSVVAESNGHEKAAILAFSTLRMSPSASRWKTMPLTTSDACKPDPRIFDTLTLSTLKLPSCL